MRGGGGLRAAPGRRVLARFDTAIRNLGRTDLVVGDPQERPDLFEFSPCHNHYHLKDFVRISLHSASGEVVAIRKHAFCLLDIERVRPDAGPKRFNCGHQGISAGWADVYSKSLECQWLDVTGVAPGDYVLEVTVNPAGVLREEDLSNNVARVPLRIPPQSEIQDWQP